jgi:uncharacterized protein (TIGR03118 family)
MNGERRTLWLLAVVFLFAVAQTDPIAAGPKHGRTFYIVHNLVSDVPGVAPVTDPNLVNAWGIAAGDDTAIWVNDNGTGVSTIYNGDGTASSLVVTIPGPAGSTDASAPTGIVYNELAEEDENAFVVTSGDLSGPAIFLFDTEDGTISGWNPTVDRTHAINVVDNSSSDAVYKGLAIIDDHLYATNFTSGLVEIYDSNFEPAGTFTDPSIPADFAPFGIQAIDDLLYVTYAKKDGDDDLPGPGNGFVDVFTADGTLDHQLAAHGTLNSPWGLALAPRNFGVFSGAVLVGNFGDGTINAFDPATNEFLGQLKDNRGATIAIDGLWGLLFGNGTHDTKRNVLYFTAGPDDEEHGLFGAIGSRSNPN